MPLEELFDELPRDWDYITLGEACSRGGGGVQTGPFGSQLHAADYVADGIPSIMPLNIGENRVIEDGIARITPEDAARLNRYLVKQGDIVYSRRGDVERRALIREHEDGWLCGTGCLRVSLGEKGGNPTYASYYLGHPVVREWIVRHAQGATMPNLNTSILSALPFVFPPPHEQRAIAQILGALDDKIELNRRMNETLEALAQSLFKSWFVDATQSALPKGWRAGTLGEIVELRTDRIDATPAKDSERYIALEDMPSKSIDLSNYQAGSAVNSSIIRFRKGDILFGSMRPYFHKVGLASFDGITRTTTFVLRPKQNRLRHFALFHFFSNEVIEFSTTSSVGTTIPYIKWDALERYQVALPPDACFEEFETAVAPLVQHIANNGEESRTLAALRDALLPKLLSGELRVHADDKYLEDNK